MILASFAALVGTLTGRQVRTQFKNQQQGAVDHLYKDLNGRLSFEGVDLDWRHVNVSLSDFASAQHAQIRIFDAADKLLLGTQSEIPIKGQKAPVQTTVLAAPPAQTSGYYDQSGYQVAVRQISVKPASTVTLLYGLPLSDLDHTLARIDLFLLLGVLGGTVLALAAG
ncbi:MAG: hypothetical protein ACLP50_19470, partial [Solirubrobacteraceae bacterium]